MWRLTRLIGILLLLLATYMLAGCSETISRVSIGSIRSGWPEYRKNDGRQASSDQELPVTLRKSWAFKYSVPTHAFPQLEEGIAKIAGEDVLIYAPGEPGITAFEQEPIVVADKAFVISGESLLCIDSRTGLRNWGYDLGGVPCFPTVFEGIVICAVQYDHDLAADAEASSKRSKTGQGMIRRERLSEAVIVGLDLATGVRLWETRIPEEVDWYFLRNYCLVGDTCIVVTNNGSRVYVNARDGKITRDIKETVPAYCVGPFVADDSNLYAPEGDERWLTRRIRATSHSSGRTMWVREFDYSVVCASLAGNRLLVVPSYYQRGNPVEIEHSSSNKESRPASPPVLARTAMRATPDDLSGKNHDLAKSFRSDLSKLSIICLDKDTGATIWSSPLPLSGEFIPGNLVWSPAVSVEENSIVVVTEYANEVGLICLDLSTGSRKWGTSVFPPGDTDRYVACPPIIVSDTVWVSFQAVLLNGEARLCSFRLADGTQQASLPGRYNSVSCASGSLFGLSTVVDETADKGSRVGISRFLERLE